MLGMANEDGTPNLEGRVGTVESKLTALEQLATQTAQSVQHLTQGMDEGFAETRRIVEAAETRSADSFQSLHGRITDHRESSLQQRGVSWPFVSLLLVAGGLIGGALISFIGIGDEGNRARADAETVRVNGMVANLQSQNLLDDADDRRELVEHARMLESQDWIRFYMRENQVGITDIRRDFIRKAELEQALKHYQFRTPDK